MNNVQPKRKRRSTHRRTEARRGSIYLSVLGVAMVVSLLGMASLYQSRISLRNARAEVERSQARAIAQAGVEFALGRIALDSSWRTNYFHGQVEGPITLAGGELTFRFLDDDGDLADDTSDPVTIEGIGTVGDVVFIYTATAAENNGDMLLQPGTWQRGAAP